jgi:hypothetical protein
MTLQEATTWLSPYRPLIGCACVGPLPGDPLCPCHRATVEAAALKRGAHIAARLILDAATRGGAE